MLSRSYLAAPAENFWNPPSACCEPHLWVRGWFLPEHRGNTYSGWHLAGACGLNQENEALLELQSLSFLFCFSAQMKLETIKCGRQGHRFSNQRRSYVMVLRLFAHPRRYWKSKSPCVVSLPRKFMEGANRLETLGEKLCWVRTTEGRASYFQLGGLDQETRGLLLTLASNSN